MVAGRADRPKRITRLQYSGEGFIGQVSGRYHFPAGNKTARGPVNETAG